jgi:alpha-methylacyl-CoA racemase
MNKDLPLYGITIIDFSQYLPGPLATKILSDLGAEVIKIETSDGDFLRNVPPFDKKKSLIFDCLNHGKKSLRLNFQKDEARKILIRLIKKADIIIHTYRKARAKYLGLEFSDIIKHNPKIILCKMLADYDCEVGHDLNFLALSGVTSLLSQQNSNKLPFFQIGDLLGGTLPLLTMVLAAIIRSQNTQKPQYIEISIIKFTRYILDFYFKSVRQNNTNTLDILRGKSPCYNIYSCKDGKKIAVAALEPLFWSNFVKILNLPHLLEKQFDENYIKEIEKTLKIKTREEWLEKLTSEDTAVSPVIDYQKNLDLVYFPAIFEKKKILLSNKSPYLGEDADRILSELGYSKREILRFQSETII